MSADYKYFFNHSIASLSSVKDFIGIADGLSRFPTRLLSNHIVEDSEGLRPIVGTIVPVSGLLTDVMVNTALAVALRRVASCWGVLQEGDTGWKEGVEWGGGCFESLREISGALVLQEEEVAVMAEENKGLKVAAQELRRWRWRKWLNSGMYGAVVQGRLDELDDRIVGVRWTGLGRSQRRTLERMMRKYVMEDGSEPKLFFREKNGELSTCILENDIKKTLTSLHEGH